MNLRTAVAAAWILMPLPFALSGLWVPLARALAVDAATSALALIGLGSLVGALALVAAASTRARGLIVACIGGLLVALAVSDTAGAAALAGGVVALVTGAAVLGLGRLTAALPDFAAFAARRGLVVAWALGFILLFAALSVRTAAFIADPSFAAGAIIPNDPVMIRHACLSAYVHGSILADLGANPYDLAFIIHSTDEALVTPLPATAAHFEPFVLDPYSYAPPFLAVPKVLRTITEDFVSIRALFALLGVGITVAAAAGLATRVGAAMRPRLWILGPLVVASSAIISAVSVSNAHTAIVGLCLLAWVAFEGSRWIRGGAFLAVGILSKISPGLLGVVLLARRQWRAALATAAASLVLGVASLPAAGVDVWGYFLGDHLRLLSSGEALGFLDDTRHTVVMNNAPFGVPFKLAALGIADWGWEEARRIQTGFTALLAAVAVIAGLRGGSPAHRAAAWMSVLFLASLRSPYAPPYTYSAMAFAALACVTEVRTRGQITLYVLLWLAIFIPPLPLPGDGDVVFSLVRQLLVIGVAIWLAVRRPSSS